MADTSSPRSTPAAPGSPGVAPGPRRRWVGFPDTVNETAARTVAAVVAVLAWTIVVFDVRGLVVLLVYGFAARVVAGPRYSPLGLIASKVVAPRLGGRVVAGPPKRFAQAMGLGFSVTASVLFLLGYDGAGRVAVGLLAGAATLEAVLGLCLGCKIFGLGMKLGIVPERVCLECADLNR